MIDTKYYRFQKIALRGGTPAKSAKIWQMLPKRIAIFDVNFEIRDRCKGVQRVDLGESFPTHILLQNLASIQPITSRLKFLTQGERRFLT